MLTHHGQGSYRNNLLGRAVEAPQTPDEATLDRVANPHPGENYIARFTAPEFTALCPVTGQPDFALLVINYLPGTGSSNRNPSNSILRRFAITVLSTRTAPCGSARILPRAWNRDGCGSAAIGFRVGACR